MSEGIKKIIRDEVRSELKLHDEYTKLTDDVEYNRKKLYGVFHNIDSDLYADNPTLNEIMKKNNEYTYNLYKGWFDDAVKKLKEFEKKNGY